MPDVITGRGRFRTLVAAGAVLIALLALPAAGRAAVKFQTFPLPQGGAGVLDMVKGPDGALWFTETGAGKIGRITPSGQISEVSVPNGTGLGDSGPTQIVVSGGALWFLTDNGQSVYRMTTSGQLTKVFSSNGGTVAAIAPSDTGGVWLMARQAAELVRLDPDGNGTPFSAGYANTLYTAGLAPDGAVWFNNAGNDLFRLTDSGATTSVPLSSPPGDEVSWIGFDGSGHLWFTEFAPPGRFTAAGEGAIGEIVNGVAHIKTIGEQSSGTGVLPHSIILGPDGAMWFAFTQSNEFDTNSVNGIGRIDPKTGQIQVVSIKPYEADDIAFGSDGDLWFTDGKDNLIGRVPLTGLFTGGGNAIGGGGKHAPAISIKIVALRKNGVADVDCKLAGAGHCTLTATIPAQSARKLGLKPKGGAKTVAVGKASATEQHAGSVALKLHLTATFTRALTRTHATAHVTITGESTAAGAKPVTVKRTLTVRG